MEHEIPNSIDKERIQGSYQHIHKLTCRICHLIALSPMVCEKCSELYCLKCMIGYIILNRSCKHCHATLKEGFLSPTIKELLKTIQIKCTNYALGCPEIKNIMEIKEHQKICKYNHGDELLRSSNNLYLNSSSKEIIYFSIYKIMNYSSYLAKGFSSNEIKLAIVKGECMKCGATQIIDESNHDCIRYLKETNYKLLKNLKETNYALSSPPHSVAKLKSNYQMLGDSIEEIAQNATPKIDKKQNIGNDESKISRLISSVANIEQTLKNPQKLFQDLIQNEVAIQINNHNLGYGSTNNKVTNIRNKEYNPPNYEKISQVKQMNSGKTKYKNQVKKRKNSVQEFESENSRNEPNVYDDNINNEPENNSNNDNFDENSNNNMQKNGHGKRPNQMPGNYNNNSPNYSNTDYLKGANLNSYNNNYNNNPYNNYSNNNMQPQMNMMNRNNFNPMVPNGAMYMGGGMYKGNPSIARQKKKKDESKEQQKIITDKNDTFPLGNNKDPNVNLENKIEKDTHNNLEPEYKSNEVSNLVHNTQINFPKKESIINNNESINQKLEENGTTSNIFPKTQNDDINSDHLKNEPQGPISNLLNNEDNSRNRNPNSITNFNNLKDNEIKNSEQPYNDHYQEKDDNFRIKDPSIVALSNNSGKNGKELNFSGDNSIPTKGPKKLENLIKENNGPHSEKIDTNNQNSQTQIENALKMNSKDDLQSFQRNMTNLKDNENENFQNHENGMNRKVIIEYQTFNANKEQNLLLANGKPEGTQILTNQKKENNEGKKNNSDNLNPNERSSEDAANYKGNINDNEKFRANEEHQINIDSEVKSNNDFMIIKNIKENYIQTKGTKNTNNQKVNEDKTEALKNDKGIEDKASKVNNEIQNEKGSPRDEYYESFENESQRNSVEKKSIIQEEIKIIDKGKSNSEMIIKQKMEENTIELKDKNETTKYIDTNEYWGDCGHLKTRERTVICENCLNPGCIQCLNECKSCHKHLCISCAGIGCPHEVSKIDNTKKLENKMNKDTCAKCNENVVPKEGIPCKICKNIECYNCAVNCVASSNSFSTVFKEGIKSTSLWTLKNAKCESGEIEILTTLQSLTNSPIRIDFSNDGITENAINKLDKLLEGSSIIYSINLSRCNINEKSIENITESLKQNKYKCLSHLNLSDNMISGECCRRICSALKENSILHELIMNNTNLVSEDAYFISSMLKANKSIKKIELNNNKFGDSGCVYLNDAIKSNQSLTYIELQDNNISEEKKKELKIVCSKSKFCPELTI